MVEAVRLHVDRRVTGKGDVCHSVDVVERRVPVRRLARRDIGITAEDSIVVRVVGRTVKQRRVADEPKLQALYAVVLRDVASIPVAKDAGRLARGIRYRVDAVHV